MCECKKNDKYQVCLGSLPKSKVAHCTESVSQSVSDSVTYWAWNDCSLIKCPPMDIVAGMRVRNVLICAWQNSGAFWTLFTAKLLIYWYILLRTWSFVSLSCISEINLVLLLQFNSLNIFQHNFSIFRNNWTLPFLLLLFSYFSLIYP